MAIVTKPRIPCFIEFDISLGPLEQGPDGECIAPMTLGPGYRVVMEDGTVICQWTMEPDPPT